MDGCSGIPFLRLYLECDELYVLVSSVEFGPMVYRKIQTRTWDSLDDRGLLS
jgi:hypothetical protein